MSAPQTFLCLTCDFKGGQFLKALKAAGNRVYLVTSTEHRDDPWPHEAIDETFYLGKDDNGHWNTQHLIGGVGHLMRRSVIDRVIALDDFDVEKAAAVREHFRIQGQGETVARYFRDKLAMRVEAKRQQIPVPAFSNLFNDHLINEFAHNTPAHWVVKPRLEASASGITKVHSIEELWKVIHSLGEHRDKYLVEQFKPGDVYHADSMVVDGKVAFCKVSKYLNTPFEVAHGGGIFQTATVPTSGQEDKALKQLNKDILLGFGMKNGVSHTEFIRSNDDGKFYFLETSSRVGGAHIAEMVEAASGINLWNEWAKLESAKAKGEAYKLPKVQKNHAGIIVSLSRFEHPDTSSFEDSEIWWRMNKKHHIGLIVQAKKRDRVLELLGGYAERIAKDFHASIPSKEVKYQ